MSQSLFGSAEQPIIASPPPLQYAEVTPVPPQAYAAASPTLVLQSHAGAFQPQVGEAATSQPQGAWVLLPGPPGLATGATVPQGGPASLPPWTAATPPVHV